VNSSEHVKCSSENICLVIIFFFVKCLARHFTKKNYDFTIVLSQYCFNNTRDLILLIYDGSPISRVTIPEAVVIQLVFLRMSSVLLETC